MYMLTESQRCSGWKEQPQVFDLGLRSPMMPLSLLSRVELGLGTAPQGGGRPTRLLRVEQGLSVPGEVVLLVRVEQGLTPWLGAVHWCGGGGRGHH